ncbi:metallophosphoesterase [Campylobacter lari]|uniref:Metallophosphoesterase n=1 Tax=Campylobacter lari TaxID=201 RepID=A0A6N6BDD3_CAMLA|nr:metallophosphoesterase [Campylobacter lari]AJC88999.1 metallophosphatase [Campylobacter lari subsp. concheus LMG 11760]EAH7030687.1 metallophosphoesterase [Campylobacter lari]EAH7580546.1 metallophosphoesterase [Campylobacter lari]EAI4436223.1 metallophosphoesterase [Campylobacter lari]EAI7248090.1 metallophosphoesterase [Campylobacter lari]
MRVFVFFTLLVLFFALANWYIYKRFLSRVDFLKPYEKFVLALVLIVFACELIFFVNMRGDFLHEKLYYILAIFPTITCFFLFFGVVFEIGSWIFFNENKKEQIFSLQRRKFLKLIFDSWLIILSVSMVFKGFVNAISAPKVNEVDIKIKNLKEDLNIALLSDVHLGKNLGEDFLKTLIDEVNALNADIIIIAGDLIDADIASMTYINLLENFKSKYGTYFVYGNHEYYNDINAISKKLKTLKNFKVLEDESIDFGDFTLSGTLDLAAKRLGFKESNIEKIKTQINQEKVNILITHQPKYVKTYDVSGFDLILSGHTHAGQIFPFSLLVYLEQGFVYGLYKLSKDSLLYVSSGAGFWGPAVRFLAPSEIALIRLKGE